jgi:uncharacterized protein (DUF1800 family)
MVEFWTDHFNIYLDKVGPALKCPDDLNVIRKNALGSFPQMLWDSAHSAAMMQYLDNAQSYSGNPNQNYARELMELHTLGVNGGYTQQDVIEVARCLTGWGLQWDDAKPGYQEFLYSSDAHDDASKVVLGVSMPAGGGQTDGERVIQILASHPSTARFLATKLIRYFYGIEPDATYRDSVAAAYMSSSGDIKATLRAVFAYPISAAAPKLKRPFHLLTGTLYTLRTRYANLDSLRWNFLGDLGHVPFDWAPPNGYPDKTGYWSGGMLQRWNFGLAMSRGDIGNMPFNASIFLRPYVWGRPTAEKYAYAINTLVFNGMMDTTDLSDLIRFLKAGPLSQDRINGALALAWCSPSYQYF